MKYLFVLLQITAATATAQKTLPALKDSVPEKLIIKNAVADKKTMRPLSLSTQIEKELHAILQQYTGKLNTAATWVQAKSAAEDKLYNYYKAGKLRGTIPSEAYFVKMDAATMSASDIASKKMILIAGIAVAKPAEFTILRIEETNTL